MSADTIAHDIAAQQGWTDVTLLDLCLTYIDNQGSNDAFEEFLRAQAAEEDDVDDEPDTDPDYDTTTGFGSGDPGYDEAAAQEDADLRVQVMAILARKQQGIDCDDDESATVKRYLRRNEEATEQPGTLASDVAEAFPLEWDEVADEDSCDRCHRKAPQISVGYTDRFGFDGLCNRCLDHLHNTGAAR